MKSLIFITFSLLILTACTSTRSVAVSKYNDSNLETVSKTVDLLTFSEDKILDSLTGSKTVENDEISFGVKINLYNELTDLFNPDNFDCQCDEKLKRKLNKVRPDNQASSGFVPRVILTNVYLSNSVVLLEKSGGNILAHGFQLEDDSGKKSKLLFARKSPTVMGFNEVDYIEKNKGTYNNFAYTLDCSGFLSAVISANLGIGKNSITSSAKGAMNSNKSLIILSGVMYSPLYQAYKGEGQFSENDSISKVNRINVLTSILNEIPNSYSDKTNVILNSNYEVIIASNSGKSSFNGEADLGASGNLNYLIASVSASGQSNASVERKSEFVRYKTYVVDENKNVLVENVNIESIKNLIIELSE
jgi:hypothetical protein